MIFGLFLSIFLIADLIFLRLSGVVYTSLFGMAVFLFLINLIPFVKYDGVRYFITKRSIILERASLFAKRTKQIPIDDATDIKSKGRNRLLLFNNSTGDRIILVLFENDLARVKDILQEVRNEFNPHPSDI